MNAPALWWVGSVMRNWAYENKHFIELYNTGDPATQRVAATYIQGRQTNMEAAFVFLGLVLVVDTIVGLFYFLDWLIKVL